MPDSTDTLHGVAQAYRVKVKTGNRENTGGTIRSLYTPLSSLYTPSSP